MAEFQKANNISPATGYFGPKTRRAIPNDRVLIFSTKPVRTYLDTKDISKAGDLEKFNVAVTRARYSVAFVRD